MSRIHVPHLMLDLETLGKGPSAAIVSIGAVRFDPLRQFVPDPWGEMEPPEVDPYVFYQVVDLEHTPREELGVMDPSTVAWWMGQSDEARRVFEDTGQTGKRLYNVILEFQRWLWSGAGEVTRLWSRGPSFDEVILKSAYERCGIPWTFPYDVGRDCRTVDDLVDDTALLKIPEVPGPSHHALRDAVKQALQVCAGYRELRRTDAQLKRTLVIHFPSVTRIDRVQEGPHS